MRATVGADLPVRDVDSGMGHVRGRGTIYLRRRAGLQIQWQLVHRHGRRHYSEGLAGNQGAKRPRRNLVPIRWPNGRHLERKTAVKSPNPGILVAGMGAIGTLADWGSNGLQQQTWVIANLVSEAIPFRGDLPDVEVVMGAVSQEGVAQVQTPFVQKYP